MCHLIFITRPKILPTGGLVRAHVLLTGDRFDPSEFVDLNPVNNTEIIAECQHYFGFSLPSKLIERKRTKFVNNYKNVSLL